MHYNTITFAALVASVASSAVPIINGHSTLQVRADKVKPGDSVWNNTEEGATAYLTFSPNIAILGELKANDILQKLADACTQSTCNPKIDPMKAQVYTEDTLTDFELTIADLDGDYAPADREKLFVILTKAANKAQTCQTIKYQDTFTCSSTGGGPGWCPTAEPKDVEVCGVPDFWSVQIGDSQIKLNLKSVKDESAKDWCTDFVDLAGGAAAEINEAADLGVQLASIGCGFS